MRRPVVVALGLVAACSSAPSADVTTTVPHAVTTTANPTVSTAPAATPGPDSAPPGESVGVSETVTIVIVDP